MKTPKSVLFNTAPQIPESTEEVRLESIINIFKGVEEFVLDTNGIIVSSNLEAVTITGYEEWEVIGRHFSIFYSVEDQIKRSFEIDLDKAIRQDCCYSTGLKMKKRNSPFWAKIKIASLKDEVGTLSGFRLTIQDATHKALYSHNLNLVKDEYLNLFNNPFIGIFKFRIHDHRILMVNDKAESIFGKGWSKNYLDSYFIESAQFEKFISKLQEEKKLEDYEFEILNTQGSKSWVAISCKYFTSVGFVEGIILDITDKKREIQRSLSLSSELESFIYHASHDLRSPITSMYGLVNLMRRDYSVEKVTQYADLIEGRLFHLDNILRDIVEIAFNTAVPLSNELIDIKHEILFVTNSYKKDFPKISCIVDVIQESPLISDLTRIRSVIRNIISNSFKYRNPIRTDSFIRINAKINSESLCLTVTDNGIGINPALSDKIFSLFYKATESHKGNGLGLYIAKSIVDVLKGEITFESKLNEGTSFKVIVPNSIT